MGLGQWLCHWLGQFLLLGLGCGYVWTFCSGIFEYGEGMADMDIVEKGTLLLLMYRIFSYNQLK